MATYNFNTSTPNNSSGASTHVSQKSLLSKTFLYMFLFLMITVVISISVSLIFQMQKQRKTSIFC